MKNNVFKVLIFLALYNLGTMQCLSYFANKDAPVKSRIKKPEFFNKSPREGLIEALEYYDIHHPKIVYAQAVLETGHFKSDLCINNNNLFGLYDSSRKRYYDFNHWSESVLMYKQMVQYKYKPPNNYYKFLKDLPYAEDKEYINKLKRIVSRYE